MPADPRLPIEYGAACRPATRTASRPSTARRSDSSDGGEGIILLDAGFVTLSDDPTVHGPHPSLDLDLAELYCP